MIDKLTPNSSFDLDLYRKEGACFVQNAFSKSEIATMRLALTELITAGAANLVLESDGLTPRAAHGCHLVNPLFASLVRDSRLLAPARLAVDSPNVYVHQFKINLKAAQRGDIWPWHRDFVYVNKLDGVPQPHLINACVFLDDVSIQNGPITFLSGSHRGGSEASEATLAEGNNWQQTFGSTLPFTVSHSEVNASRINHDTRYAVGPAGTAFFFHPQLLHSSPPITAPLNDVLSSFCTIAVTILSTAAVAHLGRTSSPHSIAHP